MDKRLNHIETELRGFREEFVAFRKEIGERFGRVDEKFESLKKEINERFESFRREVFGEISGLRREVFWGALKP